MGNITGAMVFQSCIPDSDRHALAADAWTVSSRLAAELRVGRHRLPLVR